MSKIQFITLIVTLVGVQVGSQYFLSHGHDVYRDDIYSLRDVYRDIKLDREKIPVHIANKVPAESDNSGLCEGGGVDYLADKINEITYQLESFSGRLDNLAESKGGNKVDSNDVLKSIELSEIEINLVYQEAISIMEGVSSDDNSKDRFDKEGEVLNLLSTIPASRRSEIYNKIF